MRVAVHCCCCHLEKQLCSRVDVFTDGSSCIPAHTSVTAITTVDNSVTVGRWICLLRYSNACVSSTVVFIDLKRDDIVKNSTAV